MKDAAVKTTTCFLLGAAATACSTEPPGPPIEYDDLVEQRARILFVGAHPDDETLAGPLIYYACQHKGNSCAIALLTRGEGGECSLGAACADADLGEIRTAEAMDAATGYGATLAIGDFPNISYEEVELPNALDLSKQRWEAVSDPVQWIADSITSFGPDVIVTLDPDHGFTGHVEHQLASRYTSSALERLGASASLFHVINNYPALEDFIGIDPAEPTESWDLRRSCGDETCIEATIRVAAAHASQQGSVLGLLELAAPKPDLLPASYLRQITALRSEPLPADR
jgi:LmbE family N-acetylglucosaminyl deacetylase